MMRAISAALMPLRETLEVLLAGVTPVPPHGVALCSALGRIAACAVNAERDVPTACLALRDGYTVEAVQLCGASAYSPVLLPRSPSWVEAGAALPDDSDAVLPPEGLDGRSVIMDVAAGEGVRRAGEDLPAGTPLLSAGERIAPRHLLVLAAAGFRTIEVRVPHLRLIVTGRFEPDAVSPMVVALLSQQGIAAETVAVPNETEAITEAISGGEADAVLVIGGTGFGRNDRSAEALARAGKLLVHGIALRPGMTAGFGEAAGRPVLLLPGRPEAALSAYLTLVCPLLAALTGAAEAPLRSAPLLRKITSSIGLTEVVFVRRRSTGIEPLGGADLPLRRLTEAEGVVVVAPEREGFPEGAQVEFVPL